ncbi:MAG: tRNA-dihydrouridine synthase family protein, partial [Candidatus Micrarchaeota archaeon]|nr:tRNA-dihydrouridine synthase family protein [Candidatus Micrarchaeota archaeon]
FTEFSNATAIVRGVQESMRLMQTCNEEMPVGIQIFGADEKIMAGACKSISGRVTSGELFASCIDINFGCPAGSVIRAGAGSALLKKPEKMAAIMEACCKASDLPITAKIRAGWSNDKGVEIAKLLEGAGAAGITVHWRTATEGRKRSNGWEVVGVVKRALEIPVIGNGGANTPERAVQFLKETECDAVMISSAALGNPGIFERSNALLEGKKMQPETWEEKLGEFQEYAALAEKMFVLAPKPLRAHAIEFLTGQPGVKIARKKLNSAKTVEEIVKIMEEFVPSTPVPQT